MQFCAGKGQDATGIAMTEMANLKQMYAQLTQEKKHLHDF